MRFGGWFVDFAGCFCVGFYLYARLIIKLRIVLIDVECSFSKIMKSSASLRL